MILRDCWWFIRIMNQTAYKEVTLRWKQTLDTREETREIYQTIFVLIYRLTDFYYQEHVDKISFKKNRIRKNTQHLQVFPPLFISVCVLFDLVIRLTALRLSLFSIAAGRMWYTGGGGLALSDPGKLCHPIIIPALPLSSQSAHRRWDHHNGNRLSGLRGRRQREPSSAADSKSFVTVCFDWRLTLKLRCINYFLLTWPKASVGLHKRQASTFSYDCHRFGENHLYSVKFIKSLSTVDGDECKRWLWERPQYWQY